MATIEKKNLNQAEQSRQIGRVKIDSITLGGLTFQRSSAQPGWKWSEDIKPVAKTESCQVSHLLYLLSGKIKVRLDDGQEAEFNPGDMGLIPPGHDGWVVGNVPAVWLEFQH
jgi:hypothetical protein